MSGILGGVGAQLRGGGGAAPARARLERSFGIVARGVATAGAPLVALACGATTLAPGEAPPVAPAAPPVVTSACWSSAYEPAPFYRVEPAHPFQAGRAGELGEATGILDCPDAGWVYALRFPDDRAGAFYAGELVPVGGAGPGEPAVPAGVAAESTQGDRNCVAFRTRDEAQAFFEAAGGPVVDLHRLDADGDGRACTGLPAFEGRASSDA